MVRRKERGLETTKVVETKKDSVKEDEKRHENLSPGVVEGYPGTLILISSLVDRL